MADYIKRQTVLDLIESAGAWGWSKNRLYEEVQALPAANVREDVQGEWVTRYRSGIEVKEGVVSTCCDMWNERRTSFCPNCGARMAGGGER